MKPSDDPLFGVIVRSDENGDWNYVSSSLLLRTCRTTGAVTVYQHIGGGGVVDDGFWRFGFNVSGDLAWLRSPDSSSTNPLLAGFVSEE